jgi:hypothetical protein
VDTPILVTEYVVIPGHVRRAAAEARLRAAQRVHASNGFVGPGGLRREIGDDHMRPFLGKPHRCSLPDTLMRWYKRLIADKFDGSKKRRNLGRPRVAEEVELLVIRMAKENPTWGYRRIQGALANLGHAIDKITVRNILRRHHIDPAPKRSKDGMSWTQFLTLHWEV